MARASSTTATIGFVLLALVATATAGRTLSDNNPGRNSINLGTAADFAVLAKSGVSTVPQSIITGDVGVSPIGQAALTGFALKSNSDSIFTESDQVDGKLYAADNASPTPVKMTAAIGDMETAYSDAAGRLNVDFNEFGSGELGSKTLAPGVYKFATNVGIATNTVIEGSEDDTWIFQVAGKLSIAGDVQVTLAGGAQAKNIVWVVAGASTFGAGSHFEGIVLGATSADFITGSSINGRVLVQTAVTLQSTTVTSPA
jgi:hypothetical protein